MNNNERRSVFILAAGLGTRLKELTHDKPKALVMLNGRPILDIVIDNLIKQGFNHFVINIHHYGEQIINFFETKKYKNIEIEIYHIFSAIKRLGVRKSNILTCLSKNSSDLTLK